MLDLVFTFLLWQPDQAKRWWPSSTHPGWEAYGAMTSSGWVESERYRRADNPAVEVGVVAVATASADPYGFLGWLNGRRAAYGLPGVAYDPNLAAWANQNNLAQAAHGLGHHVMGTARRQNAGQGSASSVWTSWEASPAHAAALFDPTVRWVGIAAYGAWWTFAAY